MQKTMVPGYAYGSAELPRSPVGLEELDRLKATVMFTRDDAEALRLAGDVLEDQVEDVLDVWYGFVADHPHLLAYFSTPDGQPIQAYLDRARQRFGRWILDTCRRPYDRSWLDYQEEIALRHTHEKKNTADGVDSVDNIPLRHVIAFIYPITATVRPFLARKGHSAEQVEAMYQAWFKAVTLQVALWSRPYVRDGDW
ncbi:protogloblin ApPgb [Thermobifida halotolerans]|uniref:Protogloblin ApPgb n=1 Tax=Thermobifida halotolerans TaxID=483545 RepID=A0A399G2D8_9ACTN|nr:protoglobin domain-containing protein [Thermobifida halotolerans]UOE19811.1 protogloblin ApPgb [Thermobifida halotolerans]